MAYQAITDAEILAGKPATTSLFARLRSNVFEIIAGTAGAPRIRGEARARLGEGLEVLTVTASDAYSLSYYMGYENLAASTISGTEVVAARFTPTGYNGNLRFNASHSTDPPPGGSSSYNATMYFYKNDILIQSWTVRGNAIARSVDISVIPGDVFEWRIKAGFSNPTQIGAISVGGSDTWVGMTFPALASTAGSIA
jgi:hypothetical protein